MVPNLLKKRSCDILTRYKAPGYKEAELLVELWISRVFHNPRCVLMMHPVQCFVNLFLDLNVCIDHLWQPRGQETELDGDVCRLAPIVGRQPLTLQHFHLRHQILR